MYRVFSICLAIVIFLGVGTFVSAQTTCPNIEGVWDFDQTYIRQCYAVAPVFIMYEPWPQSGYDYTPGTVTTPDYVKKMGTHEIFQDPNNNCLFWAKRTTVRQGPYTSPPDTQQVPPILTTAFIDWYVGMIHNDGSTLTMRVIPNDASPAARIEGKITSFDKRTRLPNTIELLVDSDLPQPLCGGPAIFNGALAGKSILNNRR